MPLESDFVRSVFQGSHTEEDFSTDHIELADNWSDHFLFATRVVDTGEIIKFYFSKDSMKEEVKYIGDEKLDVITNIGGGTELEEEIYYCPRCVKAWRETDLKTCQNCSTEIMCRGVKPSA